ncbi:MAG TPA: peptidylprolyl isomerase [Thermoproteota archaeon]|nr:peptidylprolyl isomerase [Thermoproteota archaeon]
MNGEGSFLLVDLTAKVQETGEVIDTTNEGVAKEAKIFNESEAYVPRLLIVGSDDVPKPLMEALRKAEVGAAQQVAVSPEQGYGLRDPSKVRILPLRKFADVKDLDVGSRVEVDGKIGTVRSITSGRVSVDFNPPLAGRTITYDVKVVSIVEGEPEQIRELIGRRFPKVDKKTFDIKTEGSTVNIKLPEEVFYVEGLQVIKRALFSEITKHLKGVDTVLFSEVYSKKPEEKPEEKKEERKEEKAEAGSPAKKPPRKEKPKKAEAKGEKP